MIALPTIFPSDNIWNVNISNMPLAAGNGTFQTSLGGASCPFSMWTQIPYVLVPSTQSGVAIHLGSFASQSDPGPSPIPSTAPVESTSDMHVLVVQAGTNKLYELYHSVLQSDSSWNADQQSIYDLTSNVLRTDTWTSADAAGLPIFPGLLRYAEVAAGIIPHCLRVVVGNGLTDNTHVWPARHHQTSVHNANYPPMGQRFRLKATKDISGFSAPMRVILQCMKSYGCMVADMASVATQFQLMADKDVGWSGIDFTGLTALSVNDFEAVDVSSLMLTSNSGQTRGGPTFTVAGISYPVEEGTLMIASKIDERTRLTGSFVDKSNLAVLSKGQKVVASDPTLGLIPFTGFIRTSTPTPLVPQPYSFWQLDAPDYFYAAEKRTSNRVYATPTPAAKIAVDLVSDVLASEGVQAAYAARTESTVSDFQQGTLSSVSAAPSIGDGDLELATSASASDTYNSQSKWSSGTISNTSANAGGDLSLNGFTRNWDNGLHPSQTLYGNGNPHDSVSNGQYILNCNSGSETRSRLDFAGTWTNATIEVDLTLNNDTVKPGFTFRTTNWNNNDDYAYAVELSTAKIDLRKGTNGAGGSTSSMNSLTFANKLGSGTYRVRVVMNGSSFSAYLNGTFQCSATDSSYGSAAMIALRNRNPSGAGNNAQAFDNFGVMAATTGTWISPGASLGAVTSIASTIVSWDTSLSQGGTIKVETSTDNGTTYQIAANGAAITGLTSGSSGVGKTFKMRVTLSTTTTATMPDIKNLQWQVLGGYVASGTRTTVAPSIQDSDTFTRADQSNWGTASSGSVWRRDSGSGTMAIASNEGTGAGAHTHNYMLLGNQIGADIDLKVRLKLGDTNDFGAILARYVDNNNFYRCNIGFGVILIDKYVNGVQTVFKSSNQSIVGGTFYWLRFLVSGSILSGKVWADGTSEPAAFQTVIGDSTFTQGAFGLYSNPTTANIQSFDNFTATHAGIFPALDLTPVGRCGSSYIGWNASVPANTSLGVDVSLDGTNWTDVSNQNGGTIPLFNATPDPTVDVFSSDTSANYQSTSGTGSITPAAWSINTSQSRVEASGGAVGIYLNNNIQWSDIDMLMHTDLCDVGGLVWRYQDYANYYALVIADASSSISPVVYGTDTFVRGNQAGLGIASDAQVWTELPASNNVTASIASNQGNFTGNGSELDSVFTHGSTSIGDIDLKIRFNLGGDSTNNAVGLAWHIADINNYYRAFVTGNTLFLQKWLAGVKSTITSTAFTLGNNTYGWLHVQMQGTTIRVRTWLDGTSEPSTWNINTTDSSLSAGQFGIAAWINSSTAIADNFSATSITASVPTQYAMRALGGTLIITPPAARTTQYVERALGGTLILTPPYPTASNTYTLYKVQAGQASTLARGTLAFTRGTYHNFRVTMLGGTITASMDGNALLSYTDNSPLGAGQCGLYSDGGVTGSRYYQLWIAPQGDDLTGLTCYTRLRLATSDSTVSPQIQDLTVAAFGQNIGIGAIIPSMDNSHVYASDVLNSLVQKSGDYYCDFIPTSQQTAQLVFRKRTTVPAPWILQPNDVLVQDVQPTYPDGNYSNRQVLKGVIGTGTFSNKFIGDSNKTSFNLSYKVAPGTVPIITLNGMAQSVGMKGTSGFGWYYAEGETDIAQDSGGTVLTGTDVLIVSYTGTFDTSVTRDNLAGQATMQALEQTGTGIVEQVTDVSQLNMDVPTAQALGDQLNIRQGILGRTLTFSTLRPGLAAGQTQAAFFPTRAITNMQMQISAVDIGIRTIRNADGSVGNQYVYAVTGSELSNQKSWQKQVLAAAKA